MTRLFILSLFRFLEADAGNSEKFAYVPFGAGEQTHFLWHNIKRVKFLKSETVNASTHAVVS